MSKETPLAAALTARLQGDAALVALAPAGVWFAGLPILDEVHPINTAGVVGTALLSDPTWVEYEFSGMGERYEATGGRWADVTARVDAVSLKNPATAALLDQRIDELLVGWIPTISGWPTAWAVTRTGDHAWGDRYSRPAWNWYWRIGGLYRFRFGT